MTRYWPLLLVALCGCVTREPTFRDWPPVPVLREARIAPELAALVVVPVSFKDVLSVFPVGVDQSLYNWYVESSPYMDPKLGWFHNANVGYTTINGQVWAVTTNTGRGHLWYRIKGIPK